MVFWSTGISCQVMIPIFCITYEVPKSVRPELKSALNNGDIVRKDSFLQKECDKLRLCYNTEMVVQNSSQSHVSHFVQK